LNEETETFTAFSKKETLLTNYLVLVTAEMLNSTN